MGFIYAMSNGGGIVNRLNTIINAIVLQQFFKRKVIVCWNDKDPSCEICLTEIYDQTNKNELEIQEYVNYDKENVYRFYDLNNDSHMINKKNVINLNDHNNDTMKTLSSTIPDNNDIVISAPNVYLFGHSIHFIITEFHRLLSPNENFKNTILSFLSQNEFQVGLHIRLTEKIIVNGYNMENFENDVNNIKNQYINSRILVCSDDPEIENKVVNMIPNSCHYPKTALLGKKVEDKPYLWWDTSLTYGYFDNLVRGKQYSFDGFVDLYLLGCCSKIVGINTGGSTYSLLANWFVENNIKNTLFS